MKRALPAFLFICCFAINASAQWAGSGTTTGTAYRDGDVGIGTSTPNAKLSVMKQITHGTVSTLSILGYSGGTDNRSFAFQQMGSPSTADQYFFLNGGLGTASVLGTPKLTSLFTGSFGFESNDNYMNIITGNAGTNQDAVRAMSFSRNGNIGIGMVNLSSFKLAVEGKIGAREIQVMTGPFPDYVFDSNYRLRSLASLEEYINQHKHLPGIQTAAEVEKNGGVELGNLSTKLLEKIEELTLYIIEINKKVENLEKENEALKNRKSNL